MKTSGPTGRRGIVLPLALSLLILLTVIVFPSPAVAEPIITVSNPGHDVFINEGESITFSIVLAHDVDETAAIVQWYRDGNPVQANDDILTFTFESDFDSAGNYKITVIVVHNLTSESNDWALTVLEVKEKFSIDKVSPEGDLVLKEGERQPLLVTVRNPAGDILAYRWYVDDRLHLGQNTSTFIYVPGLDDQGDRVVRVVIDSEDHTESHQWKVRVTDALEVWPVGDISMNEGEEMEFTVLAPRSGTFEVKWFLDGPGNSVASGSTFVYRPGYEASGKHTLMMNITGGASYNWTITVREVNRPPVVQPGKVKKVTVGSSVKFPAAATDPDNDIVTYEWDFDGDGEFDYTSDRMEDTSHTYKKAGVYLVTYRVTDDHGQSAYTVYQCMVSEGPGLTSWDMGAILLAVLVVLVLLWMVRDRAAKRKAERSASQRLAEVPITTGTRPARAEGQRRPPQVRRETPAVFEDIEEEEEGPAPEDLVMVPYDSKMKDRFMEAEGEAGDTEIHVAAEATTGEDEGGEGSAAEGEPAPSEELDDILASLTAKADAETKADLKVKKASAEAGAEDTDITIGPAAKGKGRRPRKGQRRKVTRPKKEAPPAPKVEEKAEEKAGVSKGAEGDLEAEQMDDVDLVMKRLIDMGLAERRSDGRKKKQ